MQFLLHVNPESFFFVSRKVQIKEVLLQYDLFLKGNQIKLFVG